MNNPAHLASELRRHALKIARPAGDTPAVMEQAADVLDALATAAGVVAWHIRIRGCDGSADWCEMGAERPECPPEADALPMVYAPLSRTQPAKWCPVHQHYKPCEHTAPTPAGIVRGMPNGCATADNRAAVERFRSAVLEALGAQRNAHRPRRPKGPVELGLGGW